MSNLSELLPTGGGQNAVDFVATGNLASGQAVALKTDGTVEAVTQVNNSQYLPWSSATQFNSANTQDCGLAYNPLDASRFVIVDNSSGCKLTVGTITDSGSSGSITYSTPVTVTSNSTEECVIKFNAGTNKFVIMYADNSLTSGVTNLYSMSGTTLTLLDTETFNSNNVGALSMSFNGNTAGLYIMTYCERSGDKYPRARTGYFSGSAITLGTEVVIESNTSRIYSGGRAVTFLYNSDLFAHIYNKNSSASDYTGQGVIGTVSSNTGSNLTFGSITQWASDVNQGPTNLKIASAEAANSFVIEYSWNEPGNYSSRLIPCTVSGTTITYGTPVVFAAWGANSPNDMQPYGSSYLLSYDGAYLGSNPQYGMYVRSFTVSGTSISLGTQLQLIAPGSVGGNQNMSLGFSPNNAQFGIAYRGVSQYGYTILGELATSTTNNTSFIGIASEAISNTATGAINVYGGINTVQTGLTIASDYYVQSDGTLSTASASPAVKVGQAISATAINLKDLT
tara:strand:+ start:185 stop:1711 length:1527 start_codon:yes stop_codon:yes gene_type:complete